VNGLNRLQMLQKVKMNWALTDIELVHGIRQEVQPLVSFHHSAGVASKKAN
jgi:hypothetical protein